MKAVSLDFCIIDHPLNVHKNPIIFITRKGEEHLDVSVMNEGDYDKAIFIIQKFGYIESDVLTFEFAGEPNFPIITPQNIKKELEKVGMKYNKRLENNLLEEFKILKTKNIDAILQDNANPSTKFYKKNSSIYKVPEVGEKLTLYFYLFLECRVFEDKCYLNLNGNFYSCQENPQRNFLKIVKGEFIRVNGDNPNKIYLKCCLKNEDLIKQIPITQNGGFTIVNKDSNIEKTKTFIYYMFEIKDSIPKGNRIAAEIDSALNFDKTIMLSEKAKKVYKKHQESTDKVELYLYNCNNLRDVLNKKMLMFADAEEFEKAATIKKNMIYLDKKINLLKNHTEKEIRLDDLTKRFSIK